MFFFYSNLGLAGGYLGVILAHAALGTPFVIITVTATLTGFDYSLARAALNLGATPIRVFFDVIMPLIRPGVISGALFAFNPADRGATFRFHRPIDSEEGPAQ